MKASKSRGAAPVRIVAVVAPVDWDKMFRKDPEGPEIQAFLNAALAQASAFPQRLPERGKTTRRRASGGSGVNDDGAAASTPVKQSNNVSGKRGATVKVAKSGKKRRKRK